MKIKEKNRGIAAVLAIGLLPLSGFATDVYLPSLPSMATDLKVNSVDIQITLSLFLISYGISQLCIGSFLDSFGRYKACLYSLLIFAASCFIVALTKNMYILYAMRIIHGFTVGIIVVAKRAYFVDVFTGDKLKHYLSLFSIVWSTGPIVAPFIGGYLQHSFGWQSNFYFLGALAIVLALLEYIYSGETLVNRTEFQLGKIISIYKNMVTTLSFTLGIAMLAFAYGTFIIYNMTGPFIIEHNLHLSPIVTGYSSLMLGIAWLIGGFIGKATNNKPFYKRLAVNIAIQLIIVLLMIFSQQYIANLYSLVFFAFLIHVGAGFVFNNYFTFCLGKFPHNAGIAGGLTGGVNYVIVSFLSYGVVNILPAKDEHNLSYSYLILVLLSAVVMFMAYRVRNEKPSAVAA